MAHNILILYTGLTKKWIAFMHLFFFFSCQPPSKVVFRIQLVDPQITQMWIIMPFCPRDVQYSITSNAWISNVAKFYFEFLPFMYREITWVKLWNLIRI